MSWLSKFLKKENAKENLLTTIKTETLEYLKI